MAGGTKPPQGTPPRPQGVPLPPPRPRQSAQPLGTPGGSLRPILLAPAPGGPSREHSVTEDREGALLLPGGGRSSSQVTMPSADILAITLVDAAPWSLECEASRWLSSDHDVIGR